MEIDEEGARRSLDRYSGRELWGPLRTRFGQKISSPEVLGFQESRNVQVPLEAHNVFLDYPFVKKLPSAEILVLLDSLDGQGPYGVHNVFLCYPLGSLQVHSNG